MHTDRYPSSSQPGVAAAHLKPERKQTHGGRTPQPGVAGYKRSAQTHAHPDIPTRSGGAQPKPGPSTHTDIAHPSQEWLGTS